MVRAIDAYIMENREGLPILKECCLLNNWDYDWVLQKAEKSAALRLAVNRLRDWKEVVLEKGGVMGDFNKQMTALLWRETAQSKEPRAAGSEERELARLDKRLREDLAADGGAELTADGAEGDYE